MSNRGGFMKRFIYIMLLSCFFVLITACNADQTIETEIDTNVETEIDTNIETEIITIIETPSEMTEPYDFFLSARVQNQYGVINQRGDVILPFIYHWLSHVSLDGVMIHKNVDDIYEIINVHGDVLHTGFSFLKTVVDYAIDKDILAHVVAFYGYKDGLYWLIDAKGDVFSTSDHYMFHGVFDGLIHTEHYSITLNSVTKDLVHRYDIVRQTKQGIYYAYTDDTFSIYDQEGILMDTYEHTDVYVFFGVAHIYIEDEVFIFNDDGELIVNRNDIVDVYMEYGLDLIIVKTHHKQGLYNRDGTLLLDVIYDEIALYANDFYIARIGNDFEIYHMNLHINTIQGINLGNFYNQMGYDGIYIIHHQDLRYYYYRGHERKGEGYLIAYAFNELGYATVIMQNYQGAIINSAFEIVHEAYESYTPASIYFIVSNEEERVGVINHLGEVIIPFDYEMLFYNNSFFFGVLIEPDYETGNPYDFFVMNPDYEIIHITDISFDVMRTIDQEILQLFYVQISQFYYQYSNQNFLDEVIYVIEIVRNNYYIAYKDGKMGAVNSDGDIIIPFIYDFISNYYG